MKQKAQASTRALVLIVDLSFGHSTGTNSLLQNWLWAIITAQLRFLHHAYRRISI